MTTKENKAFQKLRLQALEHSNWEDARQCGLVRLVFPDGEQKKIGKIYVGHDLVANKPQYIVRDAQGREMLPPTDTIFKMAAQLKQQLMMLAEGIELIYMPKAKLEKDAKELRIINRNRPEIKKDTGLSR